MATQLSTLSSESEWSTRIEILPNFQRVGSLEDLETHDIGFWNVVAFYPLSLAMFKGVITLLYTKGIIHIYLKNSLLLIV